jgi:hypothetical protein
MRITRPKTAEITLLLSRYENNIDNVS